MIRSLLIQMAQELEFRLEASKGGNVPGVTEDHRYEMGVRLHTLQQVIADLPSSRARWTDGYYSVRWQDRSGAFQGRRYALTQEGKAQAEAHFAKLTAPSADGPGPSAQ